jgi:Holliday junction DNA helicase RuvA
MIAQISGKIAEIKTNCIILDIGGIGYEIFIPAIIMQEITANYTVSQTLKFITYHYLQAEPNKSKPVLIGFLNEIERDFFEQFITVSGIGPRAAIKALNQPISRIAKAIDDSDVKFLCGLPGIGQQRAKEIIAKLQGKVGKFGLIQDKQFCETKDKDDLKKEVLDVLLQLQYKKNEAEEMIQRAIKEKSNIVSPEELLNEIYKQRKND